MVDLTRALAALEQRVARLEAASRTAAAPAQIASDLEATVRIHDEPQAGGFGAVTVLSALGRLCLVFCGGFLLRALTTTGTLPQAAGIVIGLGYAALWLALADRSTATGRSALGIINGLAAAGLAFPLLWEATTTFAVLSPTLSALAVASFSLAGLVVASRRRLRALAVSVALPAAVTLFGLAIATRAFVPFTAALLVLTLATIWLANELGWGLMRWPIGAAATVLIAELVVLAADPAGFPASYRHLSVGPVLALALFLPLAAVASAVVKTFLRAQTVGGFDVVFTGTSLVVGVYGAARVLNTHGAPATWLGLAALAVAVGSYTITLAPWGTRTGSPSASLYFSSLGLVLALAGIGLLVSAGPRALAWSTLAVAAAGLGLYLDRLSLVVHSAAYLWAAALACRLPTAAITAMTGQDPIAWQGVTWSCWLVTLAGAAAYLIASRGFRPPAWSWPSRLPHGAMAVMTATGAAGLALSVVLALLPDPLTGDASALAASRTGVLAGSVLALVAASSRWGLIELRWLAYLVLTLGGLKLVAEDLRHGSPLALFVAFALYGGALLMVARHGRSTPPALPPT